MAFGNGLNDNEEVMSEINMTPLVDVMLVLLIIFIIAMPLLTHSIKVDLPQVSNTPNKIKTETITLSVSATGQLHWNETLISKTDLSSKLKKLVSRQPQPDIQIRGDRVANYEWVLQVMAAVQQSGFTKVGFVTSPHDNSTMQ